MTKPDANGWLPISTAPKDELIDLWCVPPDDVDACPEAGGIRLTNCSWANPTDYFPHEGWSRVTDDGNWDIVDAPPTSPLGLPRWVPTHWRHLPGPPVEEQSP